jgi:hypothetical protein
VTEKTATVTTQRLCKHDPVARQQINNNTAVGLQQWNGVFLRGPCRSLISNGPGQLIVTSVRSVQREDLSPEAEE